VLEARPGNLAVLPVSDVEWSDLGDPARVQDIRSSLHVATGGPRGE
jgi:hypothetical protein